MDTLQGKSGDDFAEKVGEYFLTQKTKFIVEIAPRLTCWKIIHLHFLKDGAKAKEIISLFYFTFNYSVI